MKKQSSHISNFCVPYLGAKFFVVIGLFVFLQIPAFTQTLKLSMYAVAPEWNNKTYCDDGAGYQPAMITAPSLSYSGGYTDKISYTYQWEQSIDGGNWKTVFEAKDAKYIPGYIPNLITNPNAKTASTKYAWRFKITDVANGNQQLLSDVYTITIYNPIKANPIITSNNDSKLYNIALNVTGGSPSKTFKWVNIANNKEILNTQNANNIAAGNYTVTISAEGCLPVNVNISTNKLDKTNN